MFCFNCGKEMSGEQKFCSHCGAENKGFLQNGNSTQVVEVHDRAEVSTQANTIFNRDVLINYLTNLRTLEVAKSKLIDEKEAMEYRINRLGRVGHIKPRERFDFGNFFTFFGFFIALFLIGRWVGNGGFFGIFEGLGSLVSIVSLVITVLGSIWWIVEYIRDGNRYDNDVKYDQQRVKNELKERRRLLDILPNVTNDLNKTNDLIEKAYSINIIPSKYRNIYGAYFLHEYISTSSATLTEALYQCVLDEISQKLDVVIKQQRETIMLLARQNALSEQVIQQNNQILQHAIATERNTALAAQYSEVAAIHAETTSQIQSYYFFKNG